MERLPEAAQSFELDRARRTSAAVLGFTSAIGACGGYLIPRRFSASIKATGGATAALGCFVAFYATCLALTWWHYTRTTFLVRAAPSLAEAEI